MQTNDVPQSLSLARARAGTVKPVSGAQVQRVDAFSAILAAVPQLDNKMDGTMLGADEQHKANAADQLAEQFDSPKTADGPISGASLGMQVPHGISVNGPNGSARSESSANASLPSSAVEDNAVSDKTADIGPPLPPLHAISIEADSSTDPTRFGRSSTRDAESALPGALDAGRGIVDGTTQTSQPRLSRGANGPGNPLVRAGMLPPTGRGVERDALHLGAGAKSLRADSTAVLQNELARAQAHHVGTAPSAAMLAASFDRRAGERFMGESGLTRNSINAEHTLTWRTSTTDGVSTGISTELGVGVIPGIVGRLSDSLDEVSDRLSQSARANRPADSTGPVLGALVGQSTAETPVAVSIAPRLGSPDWSGAFAQAVAQVAADQLTEASLTINPPELGVIEIDLELRGDEMHVAFLSDSAEVRNSVESGLPALSQLLEKQGLSLGSADVRGNDRSPQGEGGEASPRSDSGSGARAPSVTSQDTAPTTDTMARSSPSGRRSLDGRIDLYA